jgi:hypothetical protein
MTARIAAANSGWRVEVTQTGNVVSRSVREGVNLQGARGATGLFLSRPPSFNPRRDSSHVQARIEDEKSSAMYARCMRCVRWPPR